MGIPDTDKREKIKKLLIWHPKGMTITDISSELGLNRNLTAKCLDLLVITGHIDMQQMGTAKVYTSSHHVPIADMLEFSSDLIIVLDSEQKILRVNNKVVDKLETPREQLVGKKIKETGNTFLDRLRIADPRELHHGSISESNFRCRLKEKEHWFRLKQIQTAFENGTRGVTLLCVDITTLKEATAKSNQHIKDLEFLAEKAREFVDLAPNADIYEKIAADLKSIIPDAKISVCSYDKSAASVTLRSWVFGMGGRSLFKKYVGKDPVGLEIPIGQEALAGMQTGRLLRLSLSFHQMLFEAVPEDACNRLEVEYNLSDTYGIGFSREGLLLGDAAIFLPDGKKIPNQHLVEAYSGAAAIALQRHILESVIQQNGISM
jgi:PAS domain S-box-containing protein